MSAPVVLVSGGNRGIGFEACRALAARGARVLLGARRFSDGADAAKRLAKSGEIVPIGLDVDDPKSVSAANARIEDEFGALDVLVNNAGVYSQAAAVDASADEVEAVLRTNVAGPWRLCRVFVPAMIARKKGRVVNVSSGMGQLSSMNSGSAAYRVSKSALNAFTLTLAADLRGTGVTAIALCPGWVRTDMGGPGAPRDPKDAGAAVAKAALDDARSGVFLRDGKEIPW